MASSPKLVSVFFLLALFSMQINAREFFSKIPSVNNNEKETFVPENEKTSVPNREEETFGKQEQEPRFIPETQNGYGLYGHESGQFPPTTSAAATTTTAGKETYEPYVTPVKYHADEPYNMIPATNNNNNNNKNTYYYNKNAYETEKQNLGEARFTERGWSTKENQNNNNYYYNGNNGYNNGEKKGMSDTRYLENGKYFYNVKSENNYYPNRFENSRGFASRNEYNENRYSNMGRYNQNQEDQFEENEEEFEP